MLANDRLVIKNLLKKNSIKVAQPDGPEFFLASGETSKYYCDVKKTYLDGSAILPLANLLYQKIKPLSPLNGVAGVALGGCHLASITAFHAKVFVGEQLNVVYVRKQAKEHGTKNLVESSMSLEEDAKRIVLLEDVITTGESSLKAADSLSKDFIVAAIVAVVDRRKEKTALLGTYPVDALFTLEELVT